jgi:hypothetical protein
MHRLSAVFAARQRVPHAPQWSGSEVVSAQYASAPVPQVWSAPPHDAAQVPAAQTWPPAQRVPHMPQLAVSLWVLVSQPSAARPLQSPKPGRQPPKRHVPLSQPAKPLGAEHARAHAPQLFVSSRV